MTTRTLDLDKSASTEVAPQRLRAVRVWLFVVAAMIAAMVLVGGATRLTESGLSIVEWKPVEGALPPLNDTQWTAAFEAYKTIPQYSAMNRGMSLAEFKNIYWWEWSHRLLGRLIGVVFFLPFVWFLWRGIVPRSVRPRLWFIFALGGLQGAVGWWMVASGLTERTEVSHYRLATHLILALVIYSAIVWTLRGLGPRLRVEVPRRLRITSLLLVALTFVQIYFGALVAGLRAGLVYNTWPLIDGSFIPDSARLFLQQPAWRNVFDNTLTVQFTHRMIAYTLLALAIAHVADCYRARANGVTGNAVVNGALVIICAIALQVTLGILTLINAVPIDIALSHQAGALVVLTATLIHAERLVSQPAAGAIQAT